MKIVVSGGGTGGHIYPALSIANAFKKNDPNCEITYIGTIDSLEENIVPTYGYKFRGIEIKGFQRKISFENVKRTLKLALSLAKVRKLLKEEKPDLVIGTGGYVTGPVVMVASLLGIKTVIHEQNVFPGVTNRLLENYVDTIFLGFEEAKNRFKNKKKIKYVGNPVRIENFTLTKETAREKLNISPDDVMILSIGGSGGSRSLNKAIKDMIPQFISKDIKVIHATGKFNYDSFLEGINIHNLSNTLSIYPYIEDVGTYMAASDLILCSAGATTLAEVNFLGKPCIVIPKKYSTENHQQYNAKMIENEGAGFCILEDDLTADVLRENIYKIINNDKLRESMKKNSRLLYKNDSAQLVYDIIMNKSE